MAEKKSKKKEKAQKMSLNDFNANAPGLDWAAELEGQLSTGGSKGLDAVLPSAPRSLMEPELNFDAIPIHGPFLLALDNAPFEVTIEQIEKFFSPIPVKNVELHLEFGRRKMPQVEFETRDHMIRALKEKHNQDIGRRTVKLKNPEEVMRESGGNRRDGGYNNRRDQDGGFGGGDPNRPDVTLGNWRDNAPAAVSSAPLMQRQPFDPNHGPGGQMPQQSPNDRRNISRPDVNVQIERNMQIPYQETRAAMPRSEEMHQQQPQRIMVRNEHNVPPGPSGPPDRLITRSMTNQPPPSNYMPLERSTSRGEGPPRQDAGYNTSYGPIPPDHRQDVRQGRYDERHSMPPTMHQSHPRDGGQHFREARNDQRGPDFLIQRRDVQNPPPETPIYSQQPPHVSNPAPPRTSEPLKERPKLVLQQRTVPLTPNAEPVSSSAIFGGAKPVDTSAREREVEEKLRRDREAADLEKKQKQEALEQAKATASHAEDSAGKASVHSESGVAVASKLAAVSIGAPPATRNPEGRPVAQVQPFRSQGSVEMPQQSRQQHPDHYSQRGRNNYPGNNASNYRTQVSDTGSHHSTKTQESVDGGDNDDAANSDASSQAGFQKVGPRVKRGNGATRVFSRTPRGGHGMDTRRGAGRPGYAGGGYSSDMPPNPGNGAGRGRGEYNQRYQGERRNMDGGPVRQN